MKQRTAEPNDKAQKTRRIPTAWLTLCYAFNREKETILLF
jgi:hypothetical protein